MNLQENVNRIKQVMGLNEAVVTRTGWWNNHRGLYSFMLDFNATLHYPPEQRKDTGNIVFNGDAIWSFFPDGRWYQYENINDALNGTNNYNDSGKWIESVNTLYIRTDDEQWDAIHGKWFPLPKMPKNWEVPRSEYGSVEIERGGYVVHKGDKGKGVREIQNYLLKLNYDLGPKGVDGFFGPATDAAVRKFQQDNNLVVDGIVGKKTYKMLVDLALPIYHDEDEKDKERQEKIDRELEQRRIQQTTNQN